mgnify:CR=1 FL=1
MNNVEFCLKKTRIVEERIEILMNFLGWLSDELQGATLPWTKINLKTSFMSENEN